MIDERERYERAFQQFQMTEPAWEILVDRRDRKRRNQRIAAGVVGIAVFVAAVWIVTSGGPTDRTQRPANEPSVSPAEDVVRGFLAAFGAFDPEAAMTYVADDADLWGLIDLPVPANEKGLSLELALLEAQGVQLTITSCQTSPFGSATSVICGFDFHAIASDVLGGGPLTGSMFVFTVRDGEIVKAAGNQYYDLQTAERFYATFAEWVYATYPRDFQVMYKTGRYVLPRPEGFRHVYVPRLTGESIRLWEQHTREYVKAVKQGTA
jgi:ketosteroid isomerase-like protein